ncbi:MAG TPA: hypothetical protein VK465_17595 [Fibrobacteria bacterium]|nr:hypothetical protein [Fibrobacteria bacterium]
MQRSPLGGEEESRWGTKIHPEPDEHPRSLPEDRSEGNLSPDPVLEHGMRLPQGHSPSGEADSNDGAGNLSPSGADREGSYGQDDVDDLEMGTDWSQGPAG